MGRQPPARRRRAKSAAPALPAPLPAAPLPVPAPATPEPTVESHVDVDTETAHRVATVIGWLVTESRLSQPELRRRILCEWPGADPVALLERVLEDLEMTGTERPGVLVGFAVEGAREIYSKAMAAGELSEALRALALIARIAGA